eukprot:TRINITY_DN27254_c0_g2_i1.p2 TRINITY_DN27254_c0_g2~~TRINITY_DN27254_c0_g2_i1.p2  ORF type:complete len:121 (-),score=16.68 TRINITY_DN27254_c0_g2_i1:31-393(-)
MLQPEDSNIFVVHLMNMFCDIRLSLCNRLSSCNLFIFFFFNDTATTEIYTRSIVGSVRCVQETGVASILRRDLRIPEISHLVCFFTSVFCFSCVEDIKNNKIAGHTSKAMLKITPIIQQI